MPDGIIVQPFTTHSLGEEKHTRNILIINCLTWFLILYDSIQSWLRLFYPRLSRIGGVTKLL